MKASAPSPLCVRVAFPNDLSASMLEGIRGFHPLCTRAFILPLHAEHLRCLPSVFIRTALPHAYPPTHASAPFFLGLPSGGEVFARARSLKLGLSGRHHSGECSVTADGPPFRHQLMRRSARPSCRDQFCALLSRFSLFPFAVILDYPPPGSLRRCVFGPPHRTF